MTMRRRGGAETEFGSRRVAVARRARAFATTFCLLVFAFCLLPSRAGAQEVVDRMVAVVNGGELITYSDLLWQLALQPDVPLESPRQDDLRRALDLLIGQRLVLQEAAKLPHTHATDKEIQAAQTELINRFPSREEFQRRLDRVGLTAEQFREIIHDRLDMENYLNFRFRSFVVVTPKEVEDYYRDVYAPHLRQQGRVVPPLKDVYDALQKEMTERRVESDTGEFLDQARAAAQITILDDSLGDGVQKPQAKP